MSNLRRTTRHHSIKAYAVLLLVAVASLVALVLYLQPSPTNHTIAPAPSPTGNIGALGDFWDSKWLGWNDGHNEYPVTCHGYTNCLKISPSPTFIRYQKSHGWTGENEINGLLCETSAQTCSKNHRTQKVAVHPGSQVTFGAWVWVEPSTTTTSNGGGLQVYIDIYGDEGRIRELQGTGAAAAVGRLNVPFGSTKWHYVEMDFTVARHYVADGALGAKRDKQLTPTGIIPIFQLNNWHPTGGYSEQASAYVRDTVLTIQ